MYQLKTNPRTTSMKAKQLRRTGVIPGVVFGKNMGQPISIQVLQKDVENFLKTNGVGYKLEIEFEGEKRLVLLKDITRDPTTRRVDHVDFQELTLGETITSIAHIFLINKEWIEGVVQQALEEITYKALPSNLIEKIEIDMEGKAVGYTLTVAELDIAKNELIQLITPLDSLVVSIAPHKKFEETESGLEVEAQEVVQ